MSTTAPLATPTRPATASPTETPTQKATADPTQTPTATATVVLDPPTQVPRKIKTGIPEVDFVTDQ